MPEQNQLAENKLPIFVSCQALASLFLFSQSGLFGSNFGKFWWLGVVAIGSATYLFYRTHKSNEISKAYAIKKEDECIKLSHRLNQVLPLKQPPEYKLDDKDFMVGG